MTTHDPDWEDDLGEGDVTVAATSDVTVAATSDVTDYQLRCSTSLRTSSSDDPPTTKRCKAFESEAIWIRGCQCFLTQWPPRPSTPSAVPNS